MSDEVVYTKLPPAALAALALDANAPEQGTPLALLAALKRPPTPAEIKKNSIEKELLEACIEARWSHVCTLCDDFSQALSECGAIVPLTDDDYLAVIPSIDAYSEDCRRNPLLAAVLHVAMDLAAAHKAVSLFADVAAHEAVEAEERNRLQMGGLTSMEEPLTASDFCPYLKMKTFANPPWVVTDEERRERRKAIAKLCQTYPVWILLPMNPLGKTFDEDAMEGDPPRGTTPLHVAVRSRNATLVKLLMKYCKRAAEICDGDGCLPLHYAVRPSDEFAVMRRALTPTGNITNENGATDPMGAVSFGLNLQYRAKSYFKSFHDATTLGRYRVRRLKRSCKLRELKKSTNSFSTKKKAELKPAKPMKSEKPSTGIGLRTRSKTVKPEASKGDTTSDKKDGERKNKSKTKEESAEKAPPIFNPTMYESATNLIRAMMEMGTIEEDSELLVSSEWGLGAEEKEKDLKDAILVKDYPLVKDPERHISNGVIRANRPWKTEQQRIEMIRLLADAYPGGMGAQSDDGGETPMILCARTLKGGNDGEDAEDDFDDADLDAAMGDQANPNLNNINLNNNNNNVEPPALDETGEEGADYEMDLPPRPEVKADETKKLSAQGTRGDGEDNGASEGQNDNHEDPVMQENNPAPVAELINNNHEGEAHAEADNNVAPAAQNNGDQEAAGQNNGDRRAAAQVNGDVEAGVQVDNAQAPVQRNGNQDGANNNNGEAPEGQGGNDVPPVDADNGVAGAAAPQNAIAGANGQNQPDPLEALFYMVDLDTNKREDAIGTPDDEGDTPLHTATRIGAPTRVVRRILDAMPSSASTPAEDGATPLHLVCRRASHLAPEGPGGLATYDAQTVRLYADAAGAGTLTAADDEGRIPLHVACYHGASPAAIAELADADGGAESLLVRDMEGHTALGVYCKHSTDFHGLRVLVERCPEAAAAVGDGKRLPIHRVLATFNLTVNVDVIKLLGTAYPRGLDAKDGNGMTPLALLCNSYRSPLSIDLPKLRDGRTTLGRCLSNKIWLMVKYLVLSSRANRVWNKKHAIFDGIDEDGERITVPPTERMLHAILREPSSSVEIVMLALIIHHDLLPVADEEGNFPLHICCLRDSGCSKKKEEENSSDDPLSEGDDEMFIRVNNDSMVDHEPNGCEITITNRLGSGSSRRRYDPFLDFNPILSCILNHDILAAERRNGEGKFPLNILVDKGSSWVGGGVERILKAFPGALFSYDMSSTVFVRAMARTANYSYVPTERNPINAQRLKEEQAKCIGAVFQLLKGKPVVLEWAHAARKSKRRNPRRAAASTQAPTEAPKRKKARTRK